MLTQIEVGVIIILLNKKKFGVIMKKIVAIFTALVMCFGLSACSQNESNTVDVSVEINCSEILSNYDDLDEALKDEKYVPADGIILEKTDVTVPEGATAIDVLNVVAEEFDISTDVSAGYAKSINNISEMSCGPMSGWVYEVNGEMIMEEYHASEGDLITWKFICSFE